MSTMEMPACFALLLVMANLALCLGAVGHLPPPIVNLPAGIMAPASCGQVEHRVPLVGTPGPPSCYAPTYSAVRGGVR